MTSLHVFDGIAERDDEAVERQVALDIMTKWLGTFARDLDGVPGFDVSLHGPSVMDDVWRSVTTPDDDAAAGSRGGRSGGAPRPVWVGAQRS